MGRAVTDGGALADEADDAEAERPLESVAAGVVTFLTLAVAFGLLALDVSYFWIAFPIGFGGGFPLAAGLVRWYESTKDDESAAHEDEQDRALADLRERYARGELTDAEFETRVERLLETESVADAKAATDRERGPTQARDSDRPLEDERA
jgi:uncharacterized membrane protein